MAAVIGLHVHTHFMLEPLVDWSDSSQFPTYAL
jgi:hypothetical protein